MKSEKDELKEVYITLTESEVRILKEVLRKHKEKDYLKGRLLSDEIVAFIKKEVQ